MTLNFSEEHLKSLVTDILQEATSGGASSAEVDVSFNKGFTVIARKGDVESIEYNQDGSIKKIEFFLIIAINIISIKIF